MQVLAQEFNDAGFVVHSKAIEIHGICSQCAAENGET
jgi:Fur family zinc uptake transcriptional regulator